MLLVISIVVLILLAKPLNETSGREKIAYLALAAGIIGNSIDRISIGAVTDFISVGTFPIFNVADSLITLSILYLVARGLKESFSSWNFKRKGKKTN
jgi:signal peptidase II